MNREIVVLITLVCYNIALLAIGFWARRRTHTADDFFIGSRTLGPVVASISASASSSSAWTLLGVSGAAFAWGAPALWLFPATLLGFVVNWFWVAPRLMPLARDGAVITLAEVIAGAGSRNDRILILRSTAIVITASFMVYVASQFQAAGNAFSETFGISQWSAVVLGGLIILIYTYVGGFWAVSLTDTLQGLLMAMTAIALPIGALVAVGGPGILVAELTSPSDDVGGALTYAGPAMIGFVIGTLGIGLGYPGQPHVVNRLMALRDENALKTGRVIAIVWAVIVYSGMIVLGLCGRILVEGLADGEQVFFALTNSLFHPVVSGLMVAAVLSAIMSTADSQLLVVASSTTYDWSGGKNDPESNSVGRLGASRHAVGLVAMLAIALAIVAPASIFSRVLFAWHAVGSALGPALLLMLAGVRLRPRWVLTSIWIGFGLTVLLHWLPDAPGDWVERLVPFAASLVVLLLGRETRHDESR